MSTLSHDRCTPKGKSISLPVLKDQPHKASNAWQSGHDKIKHSRVGRWRAAVLIAVHIGIAVHILLWLSRGRTISPVEPSESMQTLREGVVNAGFVFFALAILSTLILGRWFCGWACHMVALQDLCSWIMMKLGVKPKPFRARLLMWVPLGLALYMFVWPVVHRLVIRPAFMDPRGRLPWWLGQSDPIPGVTTEFIVKDFWATFGPWWMAAPFALTCTFAVVYFLGSKGFCTYGCPYGGFFAPADTLALGKIRVTDACHQCGHCTAVCTSNVRVHEEVRDFGMVIDKGCMKCMDCVSVCPNEALYFGLGMPAILARPKNDDARERRKQARALRAARYDLKWYEELAVALLFLVYFYAFRGMFNHIPMLMAVAMGGILSFSTWKLWRMRPVALGGTPNIRQQAQQLRFRGGWKPAGVLFALGTIAGIAVAAWGVYVKANRYQADRLYATLSTPLPIALRPDFQVTPDESAAAKRSIELLKRTAIREGGIGWSLTPDQELNIAYMSLLLGDVAESERRMQRIIDVGHPQDSLISQVVDLMRAQALRAAPSGQLTPEQARALDDKVVALNEHALEHHPELDGVRQFLSGRALQKGAQAPATPGGPPRYTPEAIAAARAMWNQPASEKVPRSSTFLSMARLEMAAGGGSPEAKKAALALIDKALAAIHNDSADERLAVAGLLVQLGEPDRAAALALEAVNSARSTGLVEVTTAGFLAQLGQQAKAGELVDRGLARARAIGPHTGQLRTFVSAAGVLVQLNRMKEALDLYRQAVATAVAAGDSAWDIHGIGQQVWQIGSSKPDGDFLLEGVKMLEQARDAAPSSSVIRHDLAVAYYSVERHLDTVRELTEAATLADRNAYLARRVSGLLAEQGKAQESVQWEAIAQRREREAAAAAAPPPPRESAPAPARHPARNSCAPRRAIPTRSAFPASLRPWRASR
jgi:tetratricopeptide (TPR) repeat protein/ferredoxin